MKKLQINGKKKAPCYPVARNNRGRDVLDAEQKKQLTQACFDFAIRVMDGKEANPQETAILPAVLENLMRGD